MQPSAEPMVRIIGRVGADTEGTVIQSTGQEGYDTAPVPPGGSETQPAETVAAPAPAPTVVIRFQPGVDWTESGGH